MRTWRVEGPEKATKSMDLGIDIFEDLELRGQADWMKELGK